MLNAPNSQSLNQSKMDHFGSFGILVRFIFTLHIIKKKPPKKQNSTKQPNKQKNKNSGLVEGCIQLKLTCKIVH